MPTEAQAAPAVAEETPNSAIIDVARPNARRTLTERMTATVQANPETAAPSIEEPSLAAPVAANEPEPAAPTVAHPTEQPTTESRIEERKGPRDFRVPGQPAPEPPAAAAPPATERPVRDWRIDEYYKLRDKTAELEQRLQSPVQPAPVAAPTPTPQPASVPGKPVWDAAKYGDRGYDGYVEDLADWKADEKLKAVKDSLKREIQAESVQSEQQRIQAQKASEWRARVQSAAIPDYDKTVAAAPRSFQSAAAGGILQAIFDSPVGPQLAYHFATNPDEVARIDSLSVPKQFAELVKLEEQYSKPPELPTASVPPVQTVIPASASQAPPPIRPLRPTTNIPVPDPLKIAGESADGADFRRFVNAAQITVQNGRFSRRN